MVLTSRRPTSRRVFVTLWLVLLLLKLWLACTIPLFADEAWYWLEGQQPGWAYSDLPGLTAWLARLGVTPHHRAGFGTVRRMVLRGSGGAKTGATTASVC